MTAPTHKLCAYKDCGKQAVACYSPDIDIKGLCFCEEHRESVQLAYVALAMQGDEDFCYRLLGYDSGMLTP